MAEVARDPRECICDFPERCGGTTSLQCTGCGGDQCVCGVCAGGGEVECDGCDDCDVDGARDVDVLDDSDYGCIGDDCCCPHLYHTRAECFTAEMAEAFHGGDDGGNEVREDD